MPKETCVHQFVRWIHNESVPYAQSCAGSCFMNFMMFVLHFTMYNKGKKDEEKDENS